MGALFLLLLAVAPSRIGSVNGAANNCIVTNSNPPHFSSSGSSQGYVAEPGSFGATMIDMIDCSTGSCYVSGSGTVAMRDLSCTVEPSGTLSAYFKVANVPPGSYTFDVIASNGANFPTYSLTMSVRGPDWVLCLRTSAGLTCNSSGSLRTLSGPIGTTVEVLGSGWYTPDTCSFVDPAYPETLRDVHCSLTDTTSFGPDNYELTGSFVIATGCYPTPALTHVPIELHKLAADNPENDPTQVKYFDITSQYSFCTSSSSTESTKTTSSAGETSTTTTATSRSSTTTNGVPSVLISEVASGAGTVSPFCPSPNGCSESVGQSVVVTADPMPGWSFSGWSIQSGASCSTATCRFTMPNNPVRLEATFTQGTAPGLPQGLIVGAAVAAAGVLAVLVYFAKHKHA